MSQGFNDIVDDTGTAVDAALQSIEQLDTSMLGNWKVQALIAVVVLIAILIMVRKIRRAIRRRRPVTLHPKLHKYGRGYYDKPDAELAAKRRAEAQKIIATSSTAAVAGCEIVRQVEAVAVDGFHRTEEALEGLKAVAAMKGANAVVNVRRSREESGTQMASGDAVVIRKIQKPVDAARRDNPATSKPGESPRRRTSEPSE